MPHYNFKRRKQKYVQHIAFIVIRTECVDIPCSEATCSSYKSNTLEIFIFGYCWYLFFVVGSDISIQ